MIKRIKYISQIENVLNLWKSIFLVWSRQVWKTSLMKYILQNLPQKSFYINLDEIATLWLVEFNNLLEFTTYINGYFGINLDDYDIILFDEIVRVKNFNIILKWLIDKYKDKSFISSASGNYETITEIIDGLAWRIVKIEVFPLDFKEYLLFKWKNIDISVMSEKIYTLIEKDLLDFISYGSYPEVVLAESFSNKKLILKSIIDSIFEKDLRNFIKEEKIIDIKKLIVYLSNNIWSLVSYEWLSNELWLKLNDVKKFLYLLEKSYIISTINPFFGDKKIENSKKQKLYFQNFAIPNYFLSSFEKNIFSWKDIEMMIFLNLKSNLHLNDEIFFYQRLNWSEIDFILKKDGKIFPIEAKSSNKDVIPKIFSSFWDRYFKDIWYFIKSTKNIYFSRELNSKEVKGIPFFGIF